MTVWVTMTDKFMSGWGKAKGKINKLVFECESWEEARIVFENAERRKEMKYVNICTQEPKYPHKRGRDYYVQVKTKADYPKWYKKGAF